MTRLVRLLAAVALTIPLLLVATPAQAATCYEIPYTPAFLDSHGFYLQGHGSFACTGSDLTHMGAKVVLQRYYASIHHWQDMTTLTASAWSRRDSDGSIGVHTPAAPYRPAPPTRSQTPSAGPPFPTEDK